MLPWCRIYWLNLGIPAVLPYHYKSHSVIWVMGETQILLWTTAKSLMKLLPGFCVFWGVQKSQLLFHKGIQRAVRPLGRGFWHPEGGE